MGKEKTSMPKGRSSNFELLRVVAMMMIVVYHIIYHCLAVQMEGGNSSVPLVNKMYQYPFFYKETILIDELLTFGSIANAIFLLLSGYFMVKKGSEIDLIQIAKKLLLQLGFATIFLTLASNVVFQLDGANHYYSLYHVLMFNGASWYIGYYFLVVLLGALFLNRILLGWSRRQYAVFLVVAFAAIQFTFSFDIINGLSSRMGIAVTGVFLYALGGYVRLYDPFRNIRTYTLFLIMAVVAGLVALSSYSATQSDLAYFYRCTPNVVYQQRRFAYEINSIVVLILAVCLFELFKRIKMPQSRFINFLGSGTFMVYLIHDNNFVYSIWGQKDWVVEFNGYMPRFLFELTKWAGATFAVGILAYALYQGLVKLYPAVKWLFVKKETETDESVRA